MKHNTFVKVIAICMIAAMTLCSNVLAALADNLSPETETIRGLAADGTVEGNVLAVANNAIIINMDNGNTLAFTLSYLPVVEAKVGDRVSVSYVGNILDCPEAIHVDVLSKALFTTLSGTVTEVEKFPLYEIFFVEIMTGTVFSFKYEYNKTQVTGYATDIEVKDKVTVTFAGDVLDRPTASIIEVTAERAPKPTAAPEPTPDNSLIDKKLNGVITSYDKNKKVTIRTSKNKSYTFKINSDTKISGTMELGATIRVTYDGYASKKPYAKQIKVTAAPDPTPTKKPVDYHTTSGTVVSIGGMWLQLDNGFGCDLAYATHTGTLREEGCYVKVKYYIDSTGCPCAVKVTWPEIVY